MTLLPWIAFAGLGAGAMLVGWNVGSFGIPLAWQEDAASLLLLCGALGLAVGIAGMLVKLLMGLW